jgi:glycosyltransferase involved in cell wall biosynthesis
MENLSEVIIVNSASVQSDYERYINVDKMRLIYQSVTVRNQIKYAQLEQNSANPLFTCAIVGSLNAWKRQDEAIKALAEVVRRGVDAHLLIVGDGNKHFVAALRSQVKDHGLEQRVTFTGYVSDPTRYFQAADVALMCSRWEPFGRVTVEAMLAHKAVIASASGGTIELISDGKTGLLYEPGNHVELADKIQYLYENSETRLRLGDAAHAWAAGRFTKERYAREVLDLFTGVVAKEKAPSN